MAERFTAGFSEQPSGGPSQDRSEGISCDDSGDVSEHDSKHVSGDVSAHAAKAGSAGPAAVFDAELPGDPSALIERLNRAQELHGHLSEPLLARIATALELPPSRVYGTASFYHLFRFRPPALHEVVVCTGTTCHRKGADRLVAVLGEAAAAAGTTPAGTTAALGTSVVRCLGTCGAAPLVVVDGAVWIHQSEESLRRGLRELRP